MTLYTRLFVEAEASRAGQTGLDLTHILMETSTIFSKCQGEVVPLFPCPRDWT